MENFSACNRISFREKFFSVSAQTSISDNIRQEKGDLIIPLKIKIGGTFDCGQPYLQHYRQLGKDEFNLKFFPFPFFF